MWGKGARGELGLGNVTLTETPRLVGESLNRVTAISCGVNHSAALLSFHQK